MIIRSILFLALATLAQAGIIFESAPLSSLLWDQGISISPQQFVGVRFELPQSAHVTGLGGAVGATASGPQEFFAALLSLPESAALPSTHAGVPFDTNPLWTGLFTLASSKEDVRLPTSLYLSSGAYALVLGSGFFGAANGQGYLPTPVGVPEADIIGWYDSTGAAPPEFDNATWHGLMGASQRFVVEGAFVPEPSSLVLIVAPLFLLSLLPVVKRLISDDLDR